MGGYMSGRHRWRNFGVIETTRELDLSQLKNAGCLEPGYRGRWYWIRAERISAWLDLQVGYDYVDVIFPIYDADDIEHKFRQTIPLGRKPCGFGGDRLYFRCPGSADDVYCGKHVLKLYWPVDAYILCRHCHRLTYASQSEDEWDRAYRRAAKIKERLGGESGLFHKPKGMHHKTHEKLRNEFFAAEAKGEEKFELYEAKRFKRWKNSAK